ncbi:MAG: hypothetical protein BGP11_02035 [Rhodobacterales bacterium 65-51]|uniref:hypothetical protein n=1 Tax=uncultured Gemmobacter sp. TaxID=1095917 RepID=UPI0009688212|nr:hypothetical protein [uncultured Gemmobacter sp.]OJY28872.1 MAG: hypothetical protein BGP11_02035 [Rhodobacterales bacterium 65-51]
MELTTGAILRRITETPLSTAAHKLATIILDRIAWKDGYNGLERGTAAFTLAHLAEKMDVSRQHLTALLAELAASGLALVRWKPNGKFAPWLFRFGGQEEADAPADVVSASGDTSLSRDSKNKTIFAGRIEIGAGTNVYRTPWAELINAAKASLACWNVDTQVIWERFLAFNQTRGNAAVPAGFLLGFMRKWRRPASSLTSDLKVERQTGSIDHDPVMVLALPAPIQNRHFHQSDLERLIGRHGYEKRVQDMQSRFKTNRFAACLAVHGTAVSVGEILA